MSESNADLSGLRTAETSEIVNELARRSAALVVISAPLIEPINSLIFIGGNLYTCSGMLIEASQRVDDRIEAIRQVR